MIKTLNSLGKVLRTVSHLKPIQVAYQLKNRLIKPGPLKNYLQPLDFPVNKLSFSDLPAKAQVLTTAGQQYHFTFLNLTYSFKGEVNWKEDGFGKLWNYNLQYLDFLRQEDIGEETKTQLLHHLYGWLETGRLPLEPYPVSLRIMNVIRFLCRQNDPDPAVQKWIHAECHYLSKNLEFHLLGNHLLENGFALLMGGHYFGQEQWINRAERLLQKELDEQILEDGAHFELSPMYHQIILFRVLEALDYLPETSAQRRLMREQAAKMLGWLQAITFRDGSIPHFNDATDGIAFTTGQLLHMAQQLGLDMTAEATLSVSGYRRLNNEQAELIADIHGISPSYQPGHAHADSFSFVLQLNNKPLVVDMGISTYQISPRRDYERSTKAHNTVTVNDQDTAEVWSGFRVGRRPVVRLLKADQREIEARLLYQDFEHTRSFRLDKGMLSITDQVNGDAEAVARLYLHPEVQIIAIKDQIIELSDKVQIRIEGGYTVRASEYLYNLGYNLQADAFCIEIAFQKTCITQIRFPSP